MTELGLALAWKMKEQVIVLWDKEKERYFPKDCPLDIHDYHVDLIDSDYDGLLDILKKRDIDFKFARDILFKNVISKLDALSLKFMSEYSVNGLGFSFERLEPLTVFTIRHLLDLGLLRVASFPGQNMPPHLYSWTGMGRIMLSHFSYKLYPLIIIDADSMCYYRAYPERFEDKKRDFNTIYKIQWGEFIDKFLGCLDEKVKKDIKKSIKGNFENADIVYWYLRRYNFDNINNSILPKFIKSIGL